MFYAWHSDIGRLSRVAGHYYSMEKSSKVGFSTSLKVRNPKVLGALIFLSMYVRENFPDMDPFFYHVRAGIDYE